MTSRTDTPACRLLAQASQRIGSDPLLIQAAGGNSSIKEQDCLWVKASGLWLRDALRRPMFVPVSLSQVRALIASGAADPVGPAALHAQTQGLRLPGMQTEGLRPSGTQTQGLRPSIETTLHALMPHPVVLHVHSVDAIAWAVQPDAQTALAALLDGIRWGWVDYHRPGLALTRAVAQRLAQQPADVLLLGNHGLVLGGASVPHAEQRLAEVVDRLRRPVRAAPAADSAGLERDAAATGWQLPANTRGHALATDPVSLARAARGVLYPDHVVFLGHQLSVAPADPAHRGPALSHWLRTQRHSAEPAPLIAIPGRGILLRDNLSEAACEMITCLADVLQRLPPSVAPVYLPPEEAEGLAHWEAEKFRQSQAR